MIRFGPPGIGKTDQALNRLEKYSEKGFRACEIPFTYGVYMDEEKHREEIRGIKNKAEELDIKLSIHAPYWINLNSTKKEVIEKSKKRILNSAKIGELLGAKLVVFHPGYYGDNSKEETYDIIKENIIEIREKIEENKWNIKIAPETTGKVNVFGDDGEIIGLVEETGCSLCVDFAHLFARSGGERTFEDMVNKFSKFNNLHCHFSGIEYGDKGEKKHKKTETNQLKKLFDALSKYKKKNITIINESSQPVEDSIKSIKMWNKINNS